MSQPRLPRWPWPRCWPAATRSPTPVAALALAALLAGCNEEPNPLSGPVERLLRANQELQRQVEAQQVVARTTGTAVVVLGAGLAVSLGLHLLKGGRPSKAPTDPTAGR
jgi:hypothetical protein